MFRRDWRQQLLVLALVSVTVTGSVAGTAMVLNGFGAAGSGGSDAFVPIDRTLVDDVDAVIDAVRARFGTVDVVGHESIRVPGFVERLDLRAQDPEGAYSASLLELQDGRYPTAPDEMAVTPAAARALDVGIGDQIDLDGVAWSVVGAVENPQILDEVFALVAPSTRATSPRLEVLIDRDGTGVGGRESAAPFGVVARDHDDDGVGTLVVVMVTLAMALTALVAASGFVLVAQRRQRQIGLLAAIGADERHLRQVMVVDGVLVGLSATIVGGVLGGLLWLITAPAVEQAANHRIDRFDLPWGQLAFVGILAVASSTVAAWWPARAIARIPVVTALARRPVPPVPVRRSLGLAVVLVVTGAVAIDRADPLGDVRPPVLLSGLLALLVGVVLSAPAAIRFAGRFAERLPIAPRIALRDLARYQARSASALGAIALGLGVSVSIIVLSGAVVARPDEGNLSDRQLLAMIEPDAPQEALDATLAARLGGVVGDEDPLLLERLRNPESRERDAWVDATTRIDGGFRLADEVYLATPAVLDAYGIDPTTIEPDTEILTSLDDDGLVLLDISVRGDDRAATIQHVDLSKYSDGPRTLVTESARRAHGWVAVPYAVFVEADHEITHDEVAAARGLAADAGMAVTVRDDGDSVAAVRTAATVVGALLALAIVVTSISLLRGESAQDLRTLAATGAPSRIRRALTASTAGALAVLGVALSLIGAYVAMGAAYRTDLGRLLPLPMPALVTIVVGVPLAAAAAGWLVGGREPPSTTRRVFE